MRRGIVVVGIAVSASAPAMANPFELLGLTSRRAGQAGTGVASAEDASALYYDPAGLAVTPGKDLSIGFIGARASLEANGVREKLAEPYGFQLAVRAPLPLRGVMSGRIVVGAALHVLPGGVARIVAPAPEEAHYAYWDRLARLVVLPGFGARIVDGLWVGAALDVLAGLSGRISASEGVTRAIDARVDERIRTIARGIAGVRWQPTCAWQFGIVYRQRFEVPFRTEARTIVGGEPIDLDLEASGLFAPHNVFAGAALDAGFGRFALDLGWSKWSDYPGPYVQVDSRLPLVGEIAGNPPRLIYSDTVSIRAGFETSRTTDGPIGRAGYAFETSPIPETQTGVSNVLDGTHHTIAIGGGWRWQRMRIDVHAQLALVGARTTKKFEGGGPDYDPALGIRDDDPNMPGFQTTNPGYPTMTSGGRVISGGITVEVDL